MSYARDLALPPPQFHDAAAGAPPRALASGRASAMMPASAASESDRPARERSLAVHRLNKSYGATVALRDVSLAIGAGEVHGLIGENGASKSTLVKILSGIIAPDSGTIEFE